MADQKNSEAYEFIEEISEKRLDLSYQIFVFLPVLSVTEHKKRLHKLVESSLLQPFLPFTGSANQLRHQS
ncbi:hypothetical protein [Galactobacillus timonensis]|uniref:hypothetical protein n=1 Tax=Galactobacillus timonensis TaxID=2041840 RepID=UPI001AEBE465|nr:hypothetical protein [Galactobacillus timonensis]